MARLNPPTTVPDEARLQPPIREPAGGRCQHIRLHRNGYEPGLALTVELAHAGHCRGRLVDRSRARHQVGAETCASIPLGFQDIGGVAEPQVERLSAVQQYLLRRGLPRREGGLRTLSKAMQFGRKILR